MQASYQYLLYSIFTDNESGAGTVLSNIEDLGMNRQLLLPENVRNLGHMPSSCRWQKASFLGLWRSHTVLCFKWLHA